MRAGHCGPQKKTSVLLLSFLVALVPLRGQAIGVSPTSLVFQSNKPDQASLTLLGERQGTTAINLWLLRREAGYNAERRQSYEGDAIDILPPQFIVEEGDSVVATVMWNPTSNVATSVSFYLVIETLPIRLEEGWSDATSELVMTTRIHVPLHVTLPDHKRNMEITTSYDLSNECVMIKNSGNHYKALADLTVDVTLPHQSQSIQILGREIANRFKTDALLPGAEYCIDVKK